MKLLAEEIKASMMSGTPPSATDERLKQLIESHEKSLRELLNQMSQVISAKQERQHLVNFQRSLSKEDTDLLERGMEGSSRYRRLN